MVPDDHSKNVYILRIKCIQLTYEIVSAMSSKVLSKISECGLTPEETAVLYIYQQFVNESNSQYLPDHGTLMLRKLTWSSDKTEIVDIEFEE